MVLQNDFATPWAVSPGANVETQAEYEADPNLGPGVQTGLAESDLYNKTARQATIFASVLSQLIVNLANKAVVDDGTTATILANLITALQTSLKPIIQTNAYIFCIDSGEANAYVLSPQAGGAATLTTGQIVLFTAAEANSGVSTINYNETGAQPFNANAGPMQGGEITSTGLNIAIFEGSAWRLIAQSNGGNLTTPPATQSNHALPLGQANARFAGGRVLRTSLYTLVSGTLMVSINGADPVTAASTYTQTPGTNKVRVRGIGGGGGGAGSVITAANGTSIGAPGTSGAPGAGIFFTGFGDAEITVGVGAPGGIGGNGGNGSTSSLGTLISWPGGIGGGSSSAATIPLSGGNGNFVVATGANLTPNATSDNGTPSISINGSCAFGGAGGRTPDGGGPSGTSVNTNANNATTLGAGGAGTANFNNGDNPTSGGNGASGFVLVEDYS
jgi:hypothetical protein